MLRATKFIKRYYVMLMLHKVASVLICETSPLDDQFR